MVIKAKRLSTKAPPKYWRFVVLLGAHIGILLSVGPAKVLGVYLVRFKEEFGATSGVIGAVTTLTYVFFATSGLFASMLCKRFSCRVVAIVGGLLTAAGFILTAFARNVFHLFLFIDVLAGIGIGLAGNPCVVIISQYFEKSYATANGFVLAGVDVGIVILPPLTDYLSEAYGWRGSLLIMGAIMLNIIAMVALFRENKPIKKKIPDEDLVGQGLKVENTSVQEVNNHVRATNVSNTGDDNGVSRTLPEAQVNNINEHPAFPSNTSAQVVSPTLKKLANAMDLQVFLIPKYLVLMPITIIVSSANSAILAHVVARGISEGIPPFFASFLLSGIGITSAIARCTHGLIIDKGLLSAPRLYSVTLLFGSIFSFLSLLCNSFATFLAYSLCYGAVSGIFRCASIPIVKSTIPSRMLGGGVAWLFIFRGIGGFLGGVIAGAVFDATGNYDASFMVIGSSLLLSSILMAAFSYAKGRKKRRDSTIVSPVEL